MYVFHKLATNSRYITCDSTTQWVAFPWLWMSMFFYKNNVQSAKSMFVFTQRPWACMIGPQFHVLDGIHHYYLIFFLKNLQLLNFYLVNVDINWIHPVTLVDIGWHFANRPTHPRCKHSLWTTPKMSLTTIWCTFAISVKTTRWKNAKQCKIILVAK